jgi:hypothetical protein
MIWRLLYRTVRVVIALFVIANGLIHRMMAPVFPRKK